MEVSREILRRHFEPGSNDEVHLGLAALDVLLLRFALLTVFYRARAAGENFCKQRIWSDVLGAIPGPKERVPGGLLCWWPLFPLAFCSKVHI